MVVKEAINFHNIRFALVFLPATLYQYLAKACKGGFRPTFAQ
jgi:hypothetical protein